MTLDLVIEGETWPAVALGAMTSLPNHHLIGA